MSAPSNLHVVLGAGGAIGNSVVRELAARGHRVRAVNRSGRVARCPASRPTGETSPRPRAPRPRATAPRSSTTAPPPPITGGWRSSPA
ncbi:NmrA family NAD(P)-binding protein [Streptosporangium lutulentum]